VEFWEFWDVLHVFRGRKLRSDVFGCKLDVDGMSRIRKIVEKILEGRSDQNVDFADLCLVLERAGFSVRQGGGSHRIYFKDDVTEILNVQPKGKSAKSYQVKQVRDLLVKYKIEVK
jgi:predicted RNA binding protein YcfA (HicA-like mRNA interferase family)